MLYGFEPPQGSTLAGARLPKIFFVTGGRSLRGTKPYACVQMMVWRVLGFHSNGMFAGLWSPPPTTIWLLTRINAH
jgi:hypothetical protein